MTQRTSVDVVVVGAGPAGAATALLLARAGVDVLLLDRAVFPRAKPCGECLSAAATGLLRQLGVLPAIQAAGPAHLEGWRIHAPSGRFFQAFFQDDRGARPSAESHALALPRSRLDAILVAAAERAGARFQADTHVTDVLRDAAGVSGVAGSGPDGPFHVNARLVVAADGLRSVVARRLGLVRRQPRLRKVSLTAHVRGVQGSAAMGEMHVARSACVGLAAVEQSADPVWNLSLVLDARRYGPALSGDRAGLLRSALEWFPALRGRLDAMRLCTDAGGPELMASGPFDWVMRRTVERGAALVGDAAGYYDPFTGQGIFQALACAQLLAEEATAALRHGSRAPLLHGYARRRRRLLGGARRLQHLIEAVLARPALAELAIERLRRAPDVADALIRVTGDLAPARTLLRPALLLSFVAGAPAPRRPHENRG